MLKDGRPEEAAGEFQKAVRIDPTNQAAEQELDTVLTQAGNLQEGAHGSAAEGAEGAR